MVTLPVPIVSMLSFLNEAIEVLGQIRPFPEVLDAVQETIIVELVEDSCRPTEFVCCLFEYNHIPMHMAGLFHLECQDFVRCPSDMVGVAKHLFKLLDEGGPLIDLWVRGPGFNVVSEMTLCHSIKVLDGIEDAGLLCGICTWLRMENEAAIEEEIP